MSLKLITFTLLCFITIDAKTIELTQGYFEVEGNQKRFILTDTKLCLGPTSNKRKEALILFFEGLPSNTYADQESCVAAGGEIPPELSINDVPLANLVLDNCELNPENPADLTAVSSVDFTTKKLQRDKHQTAAQINCYLSKDSLNEDEKSKKSILIEKLVIMEDPTVGSGKQVSKVRIISSFEFGTMKLPKYENDQSTGFSDSKFFFDSKIDGRFHFNSYKLLMNTSFEASFYGSGTYEEEPSTDGQTVNTDQTINLTDGVSGIPTKFNQVSDTLDASFTARLAADNCYSGEEYGWLLEFMSCLSSSTDKNSTLGLTLSYGFINKEKRLADEDTVNDYRALGLEYRHYRKPIGTNSNRIPDFIVSYERAKFEEYGYEQYTEGCAEEICSRTIEDVYRYLVKLKYRLIEDKPFFIGFRLNAGPGPDDYGLTLGIRKSGTSVLDILGVN